MDEPVIAALYAGDVYVLPLQRGGVVVARAWSQALVDREGVRLDGTAEVGRIFRVGQAEPGLVIGPDEREVRCGAELVADEGLEVPVPVAQ